MKKRSPKVEAFLAEVIAVSRKHGLSIDHEDNHGAFLVVEFSEENAQWLNAAYDETSEEEPKDHSAELPPTWEPPE